MAVLTKTHPNEDAAHRVVGARWAAAEPLGDILLLTGRPLRDIHRQAVGGFAGPRETPTVSARVSSATSSAP
jgi:hypothetical protein